MLLLLMVVYCVLFGSSAGVRYEECYGGRLKLPLEFSPPIVSGSLYFTPSNGGGRKLVMSNGVAKVPNLKVSSGSVEITDLRYRDAGTYTHSYSIYGTRDIVALTVQDCGNEIKKNYGDTYYFDIPRATEYLEFSMFHSKDQTRVLWNRTDPHVSTGGRGEMKPGRWEITSVTQEDNGFYDLRNKYNTLLSRIKLTVRANTRNYDPDESGQLFIHLPSAETAWTVTFTPLGETEKQLLIKEGSQVTGDDGMPSPFNGRIQVVSDGLVIYPVESTDSGSFEIRDTKGNVAYAVSVMVIKKLDHTSTFVFVAILFGVSLFGIAACCCGIKFFSKRSYYKRNKDQQDQNQPAGPSHSAAPVEDHSYQPVNPRASTERAAASVGPSAAASGEQGDTPFLTRGSDCLSLDPEPKFELKGLNFPSATPLSSDTTYSDVYTSDKLNFL